MGNTTTWAGHHGTAAVEALVKAHPQMAADHIRDMARRWHATENLPGFLAACTGGDQAWALTEEA